MSTNKMLVKRLELIYLESRSNNLSILLFRSHQITKALVSLCGYAVLSPPFVCMLQN